MAQALAETIFDVLYLFGIIIAGILMLVKGGKNPLVKKFGMMAILLGAGDSFHLVPRSYSLWTTGLEANAAALGIGKLVTSITMTIFYLILYYIWREYYQIKGRKKLTAAMWILTAARIALCLLPQNDWLAYRQPLFFDILRNLPFAAIGVMIIILFAQETKKAGEPIFHYMPAAVTLSFAFYVPVVLFSSVFPIIGVLMIPKTLAYVWIVLMGWRLCSDRKHAYTDLQLS